MKYKYRNAAFAVTGGMVLAVSGMAISSFAEDKLILDEITVTAQKRAQNLQDVPIAVSAIDGKTIARMGIGNFEDIEVPGVTVTRQGMTDGVSIRGIGSDANFGFEQSVPTYIDGLYFGRARTQRLGFMDVGSIEFLKGPQPTHLGKNAIAGAINITTRKATDEFEATLDSFYEFNHKEFSIFGAVSGPISEKVRARVSGKYRTMDGWVENVATNNKEPSLDEVMGRFNLEIDASEDFSISLSAFATRSVEKGRNNLAAICGTSGLLFDAVTAGGGTCAADKDSLVLKDLVKSVEPTPSLYTDELTTFYNKVTIKGFSARLEYDIEGYTLSSLTGYYDFENLLFADADHSSLRRLEGHFPEEFDQFSQEFRLLSPQDESFRWSAGFYYDKNNNNSGSIVTNFIAGMGMGATVFRDANEDAESWSVFAEASLDLSETLTATLGGRYSEVKKDIDFDTCNAGLLISTIDTAYSVDADTLNIDTIGCTAGRLELGEGHEVVPNRKDTKFQPAVTLEWRPNDNSMVYASWKEGFKAGGFDHNISARSGAITNDNLEENFMFEPEEVSSFEVGAKLTLLDGAAELNIAAFTSKFNNLQVSVLEDAIDLVFSVGNAAEAKTQGVEFDFRWATSEYMTLSANASILDSKYESFQRAPCYSNQSVADGCVVESGGSSQNLSGHQTTYAPSFSSTVSADFNYPINESLEFVSQVSLFYTSGFFPASDFDPNTKREGYAKIDIRAGVGSINEGWQIAVVARNITNKYTSSFISDLPTLGNNRYFALIDRPRTIALQAKMDF